MKKHIKKIEDLNVQISKSLTYYLRHGAEKEGLEMRPDGYVSLDSILLKLNAKFHNINYDKIKEIVDTNDKKRFELSQIPDEKTNFPLIFIRATQGHTLKIVDDELLLTKIEDPSSFLTVVHGTFRKSWESIKKEGLKTMSRNHVHFAPGYPGEAKVVSGMRNNCNLFIEIDLEKAFNDGMAFYLSQNNVILSNGFNGVISPKYFKVVKDKDSKIIFEGKNFEESKNEEEEQKNDNASQINSELDYVLVLDFEAQCDQEGSKKINFDIQEIIEFPVIPINLKEKKVEESLIFHHYIKPVKHPILTEFCTSLTGIKQEQVEKGILLEEALELLHQHLTKHDFLNKKWCFVTCGDWDLNQCLKLETRKKGIILRDYMKRWINIKKVFTKEIEKTHKTGMPGMLEHFKLSLDGRHHSGIDDCRNISKIVLKIAENGVKFDKSIISEYK